MRPPIIGQAHRQLADPSPAGPIRAQSRISRHTGDRSYIDDAPITTRDHTPGHRLRHKEAATQVRVENKIPVIPRNFKRRLAHVTTRVVDEDIDLPERFFGGRHHLVNALPVAYIQFERDRTPPQAAHLRLKGHEVVAMATGEYKVRSGSRQGTRECLTQPATGSSHDGDPAA